MCDPNPTGAVGVDSAVSGKPIVDLPGCPPNPYNLLAVVLDYVTMGRLPQLDEYSRPKFAYDRVIHENCPRRGHFDAGRSLSAPVAASCTRVVEEVLRELDRLGASSQERKPALDPGIWWTPVDEVEQRMTGDQP